MLTLSSLQINTDILANSADPDEMACNKTSHQDLHYLPFWYGFLTTPLFATMDVSKFRDGSVHFRNSVVKVKQVLFIAGMDMVGIVQRDGKRSTWKNTAKSSK